MGEEGGGRRRMETGKGLVFLYIKHLKFTMNRIVCKQK